MSHDDLSIDDEGVQEALSSVRKYVYSCGESSHDAQWMTEDQTSAKWGTEKGPAVFSGRYYEFLTRLRQQIDLWQADLTTVMKRVDQAQERLRDASEAEASAINQVLVDEWVHSANKS